MLSRSSYPQGHCRITQIDRTDDRSVLCYSWKVITTILEITMVIILRSRIPCGDIPNHGRNTNSDFLWFIRSRGLVVCLLKCIRISLSNLVFEFWDVIIFTVFTVFFDKHINRLLFLTDEMVDMTYLLLKLYFTYLKYVEYMTPIRYTYIILFVIKYDNCL